MNRVHLGMKRPIRQFDKYYKDFIELINEIEKFPPKSDIEKVIYVSRIKNKFNDCLIQLNNIRNTQIEYLESKGE